MTRVSNTAYQVLTLADRLLNLEMVLEMAESQAHVFKRALLSDLLTKEEFDKLMGQDMTNADKQILSPIMDAIKSHLPESSPELQTAIQKEVEAFGDYDD